MEQFKPRNEKEWKMQADWLKKHIDAGGSVVVDGETKAVIRVEYDNPIYHFYKHNYEQREILLAALGFMADEWDTIGTGEIPAYPPEIETIKARIYGKVGIKTHTQEKV